MRSPEITELSVSLDRAHPLPLPQQLAGSVRALIDRGVLRAGDALPSSRAWAARLGVSRGTIVTAFEQLTAEGYLTSQTGAATTVNPALGQTHPGRRDAARGAAGIPSLPSTGGRAPETSLDPIDLLPGQPSTGTLRTPAWRRAWRNAADADLATLPLAGDPRYLAAVSEHFRRMRGLARDAGNFLVTAGAREGLALIVQTIAAERAGAAPVRVGVESPGYPSLRRVLARLGCELVPLKVDRDGLRTDRLPRGAAKPDLVIVTPSHQYPFGGSLPISRRQDLLAWARTECVLIVEDDFDSELRYVGQPLPTLTALDRTGDGTVALLGTFSSTVAPTIGIGMLGAPAPLRERLLATRADLGTPVSAVTQRAFAEYLASGELARHAARMRRSYRQRRAAVLAVLGDLPQVEVSPMDGGLHAVIHTRRDEAELMAACERAGVRVSPGAVYWREPSSASPSGPSGASSASASGSIVIGYAHLSEAQLAEGLARLRAAL
ncbi:PLP-dependent aminotransferase family protein [Gulosibacter sediminis]|uniref:MocR-like pyridoxine biosynthesis transcription factor PdxR n=1 Tax=Gulosibacter sediminis TaxID=1729695 RepID=UPI0024ADF03F|nr:PLP-dependent aminotransferase family protein [Gulosibacter sediminis]